MAKREGWEQRRRRGVQGKAVEYHIGSLPITILNSLQLREEPAQYATTRQDPLTLWVEAYYRFTEAEREQVISFIFREGAKALSNVWKWINPWVKIGYDRAYSLMG